MSDGAPTFFSLFAGIGGFDLALERAGFRCAGEVEIDPFCRRVLERRWPGVSRHDDIRTWESRRSCRRGSEQPQSREGRSGGEQCERGAGLLAAGGADTEHRVDLLVGGFPCQDLSIAGRRAGLGGERSGLFGEIVRIAPILRPTWGIFENVPGLLSSAGGRDMGLVLAGLRECWPAVGYRVLDSRWFGVPQRRRRVFFVCGPDDARVAAVLFEPEGGGGHPAAGREAGARVARSLAIGASSSGYRYDPNGEEFVFEPKASAHQSMNPHPLAPALGTTKEPAVVHALTGEGHDASEDGTGRGTPMVTLNSCAGGNQIEGAYYPQGSTVRRLTPLECERLQAFPDGWSCLCQLLDGYAADPDAASLRCGCPDGPRYRALGNAVTVSVVEWIGRRLIGVMIPR